MTHERDAAETLLAAINALPTPNTPALRTLRRAYTAKWRNQPPEFILAIATELQSRHAHRWIGYELIRHHQPAFAALNNRKLADLARFLDSWDSVDAFARILSGPAWAHGRITDTLIHGWAASPDRWRRRTALVSTVALNMAADGGNGDPIRTLAICHRLAADPDDMVQKALSWSLRALIPHARPAVEHFLATRSAILAPRIKREVRNKLQTGLKNPHPP